MIMQQFEAKMVLNSLMKYMFSSRALIQVRTPLGLYSFQRALSVEQNINQNNKYNGYHLSSLCFRSLIILCIHTVI